MTGTGTAADPFVADGLEIEVGGAADVGDTFLIRPTRGAVADMDVLIIRSRAHRGRGADPHGRGCREIPAPARSPPAKCSTARMRSCALRSRSVPDARRSTRSTVRAASPYTAGGNIDVNGWRVQICGAPAAGDSFTVSDNTSGTGDNRNALLLADALQAPGAQRRHDFAELGRRPVRRRHRRHDAPGAGQSRRAERRVRGEPRGEGSVSGVNLDEEAANLLRYQQAYLAAAQMIRVADTMFQTVLAATER